MTASSMESDQHLCLDVGMNRCVMKPIAVEILRALLEEFCPPRA